MWGGTLKWGSTAPCPPVPTAITCVVSRPPTPERQPPLGHLPVRFLPHGRQRARQSRARLRSRGCRPHPDTATFCCLCSGTLRPAWSGGTCRADAAQWRRGCREFIRKTGQFCAHTLVRPQCRGRECGNDISATTVRTVPMRLFLHSGMWWVLHLPPHFILTTPQTGKLRLEGHENWPKEPSHARAEPGCELGA